MIFRKKRARLSQAASLKIARAKGLPVASVLDVGVQRATGSLIEVFPDIPHLLFEPVRQFHPDIRRNYRDIHYEIVDAAVSDVDGEGFLKSTTDGKNVSCAWLSATGDKVKTVRLDTIVPTYGIKSPFLLKIDVDGSEGPAKIIEGAAGIMSEVSCIVSEMVATRFLDLAGRIGRHEFILWDVVESCYYDKVFYQCDAIFIRKDFIAANPALRPFDFKSFDPAKWKTIIA